MQIMWFPVIASNANNKTLLVMRLALDTETDLSAIKITDNDIKYYER